MKVQLEDTISERVFTRCQICWQIALGLLASRPLSNKLFLRYPAYILQPGIKQCCWKPLNLWDLGENHFIFFPVHPELMDSVHSILFFKCWLLHFILLFIYLFFVFKILAAFIFFLLLFIFIFQISYT